MINFDEYVIRKIILISLWIEFLWELYLSLRQLRKIIATTDIPNELRSVIKPSDFEKARQYSITKLSFGVSKDIHSIIITSLVIYYGFLGTVWFFSESMNPLNNEEVVTSCIWLFIISLGSTIVDLPFNVYSTFVIEDKFGFNKQTATFFIWDKVKAFFVSQLLTLPISMIIILIIKNGGPHFFIWLWAVVCVICLFLLIIYPAVIAPLFDKYTPLPEGKLRTEIENLAVQLNFPLTQLYVVEGSKRSSHSNAYFYGLFNSKRIVLFDTLLKKEDGSGCNDEEILAVLSHELGHWSYSHVTKNLVIMQINLLLSFALFSVMFKFPSLYKAFGFYDQKPVLAGLIIVLQYVMMLYNTLLSFIMTCISRRFEFQADHYAVELGKAVHLKTALVQLNKDNLGFPINDNLYSMWHHSHPPLLERISILNKNISKLN